MYPDFPFSQQEINALIDTLFASSEWLAATTEAEQTALIESLLDPYRDAQIAALVNPAQTVVQGICDGFVWLVNQVRGFWAHKSDTSPTRPTPPSATVFSDYVEHFWYQTFGPVYGTLYWTPLESTTGPGGSGG